MSCDKAIKHSRKNKNQKRWLYRRNRFLKKHWSQPQHTKAVQKRSRGDNRNFQRNRSEIMYLKHALGGVKLNNKGDSSTEETKSQEESRLDDGPAIE